MASLRVTHAIVCRLPSSSPGGPAARLQHEALVTTLRDFGLDVIELPTDETLPHCGLVEDTAIVCNGVALITKPGLNANRVKEVDIIRSVFKKELDIPLVEISDEKASLDGGDVVFTGKEFFVGLSEFTNEAGAKAVAAAFPEFPCTAIQVPPKYHLKSLITVAGPDVICISSSILGQEILKKIKCVSPFGYQMITVPEEAAANVCYINGTLLHRTSDEIPESAKVFSEIVDYPRKAVSVSELMKCEPSPSGLSSFCLLVKRTRHIRHL